VCGSTGQATALWFRSFNAAATECTPAALHASGLASPLGSRLLLMWLLMCGLAQMRSAERIQKCLLFAIDRTYRRHVLNDANDPKRTWRRLLD
jgi:hypothetical protein